MSQTAAARRYIRFRTRGRAGTGWTDRYLVVAAVVIVGALALAPIRAIAHALSTSEPRPLAPGLLLAAICTCAFMGAMRWLGPVVLPANDVHWLLLSPLPRGAVLRRPALPTFFLGTASAAGLAALSVLGARDHLPARMALAPLLGAGLALAGWAVALHAQRSPGLRWTVSLAGLAAAPVLLLTRAPLPLNASGTLATLVFAVLLGFAGFRALQRFPARAVVAASQRLGTAVHATVGLQPSDFTRAAEDSYWRARRLKSRPWPGYLPLWLLMAWPDWRMLGRRPARLVLIAASAAIPALLRGVAQAIVLFGLSLAVAAAGTTSIRRGTAQPREALLRLGFLCLPAVLAAAWLAIALSLARPGAGRWLLLGVVAAPSVAVGAMRMAGRGPVDHTSMPVVMPMSGSWIPTGWIIWSFTGLDVAVPGCLPLLLCLFAPAAQPAVAIVAQMIVSATVVGVWCGKRRPRVSRPDGH